MVRIGLDETAHKIFAARPDKSYAVGDIRRQLELFKAQGRRYRRGEIFSMSSAKEKLVAFVMSGVLHVKMASASGEDILLGAARPGEFVGLSHVYEPDVTCAYDVVAISDAELVVFGAERARRWRSDPRARPLYDLMGRCISALARENRDKAMILSGSTIAERVRRYLAVRMRRERSRTITVPGTLTDLATYLGVNRCALSRVIGQLTADGEIRCNRNVITIL